MNQLFKNLKSARKDAQLTQDDIAKHCGVSRNAVTQWESEREEKRTEPSIDKLKKISELTGWTVGQLISGKDYDDQFDYQMESESSDMQNKELKVSQLAKKLGISQSSIDIAVQIDKLDSESKNKFITYLLTMEASIQQEL